ncbi:hypothetical protein C8J56DRAFT_1166379 [Mycena floridula]|nr:hypothetical protein C8J56DRAFT_1166379 [Mycena floridula]
MVASSVLQSSDSDVPEYWQLLLEDSDRRSNALPIAVLHRAAEFTFRLQHLSTFMRSAQQLLCCQKLADQEFILHFHKIVELVEICKQTLQASGLSLYRFSFCPSDRIPHKRVYYDLLIMLKARRHLVPRDSKLQRRISRLVFHLDPSFMIERENDPFLDIYAPEQPCPPRDNIERYAHLMPPPHVVPRKDRVLTSCFSVDFDSEMEDDLSKPLSPVARRHGQLWNKRRPLSGTQIPTALSGRTPSTRRIGEV